MIFQLRCYFICGFFSCKEPHVGNEHFMCNNASETTLSAKLCQCRINVPGKGTLRRRMIHQELIEWIRREFFIFLYTFLSLSHTHKLYSKVLISIQTKKLPELLFQTRVQVRGMYELRLQCHIQCVERCWTPLHLSQFLHDNSSCQRLR